MSAENVALLLELYAQLKTLCAEGKGESAEADALRDEMDKPWYGMTASEQQEFRKRIGAQP